MPGQGEFSYSRTLQLTIDQIFSMLSEFDEMMQYRSSSRNGRMENKQLNNKAGEEYVYNTADVRGLLRFRRRGGWLVADM